MLRKPFVPPQSTNPEWIAELKSGKRCALGCALNLGSTLCAQVISSGGVDFCLVDYQHSAYDLEKLRDMITAVQFGGAKAFVRVGGCSDRIGIQQSFDLGADGILVPCAESAADVKQAVSMAKYPVSGPGSEGGTRSVYLNLRPQMPGGFGGLIPYLIEGGNKQTILMFQIETAGALNEVEEICKIPGVDCAFIGPGDLATSMGLVAKHGAPGCWGTDEFQGAVGRVAKACADNGVVAGFWSADVAKLAPFGFRLFIPLCDMHDMRDAIEAKLKEKRQEAKDAIGDER